MNKEEIKYDPVRDSFLKGLTYISSNPNNVLKISSVILIVLLLFIFYSNNTNKTDLAHNKLISITTNKHLDNQTDLSIPGFKEVLSDYSSSESYNQAYIYMFNYYMQNNLLDSINTMIENSKFNSNDDNIEASLNLMYGDFYLRQNNIEMSIEKYKNAINLFNIYDRKVYAKLKLCMIFNDLLMFDDYNNLYSTIEIDKISDFQLKSMYEQMINKN
ncbi:MAG: hypothetical protein CMG50_03805 [Candidatus Marinimicrobia bacterium]|nr:hypothetical protein [Candidatus Neomarinimicrobiota bacterium]|tara:strand:+ start:521 stop:1168 length:648 start_codon:yes stop_codon:yes gene_type:complete